MLGLYRDNGKDNGNYSLEFKAWPPQLRPLQAIMALVEVRPSESEKLLGSACF